VHNSDDIENCEDTGSVENCWHAVLYWIIDRW